MTQDNKKDSLHQKSPSEKKILSADGVEITSKPIKSTHREKERLEEDQRYIPVIIKRTDEVKKHPDDILNRAIYEGLEQLKRARPSLFLSAFSAGIILGSYIIAVAAVASGLEGITQEVLQRLAIAVIYPAGFIVCIMSGTQLFTEQTATALYPILDQRESWRKLIILWIVVLAGNFAGTFFISILIAQIEPIIGISSGIELIVQHLLLPDASLIFLSSVIAGAMMAQVGWLVLATPPQTTQMISVYIATFVIGVGGLHHSIAGSAEIFLAFFLDVDFPRDKVLHFFILSPLGNLVGGTTLVAILNYGHVRKTQKNRQ
ncbi:MAG: formate/nitrite transporter family protein [Oligoflexus sp.]